MSKLSTIQVGWKAFYSALEMQEFNPSYYSLTQYWIDDIAGYGDFSDMPTTDNNPAVVDENSSGYNILAKKMPLDANGIKVRWLIGGADNYTAKSKLYVWERNGSPLDCFETTLTAGRMTINVHPVQTTEELYLNPSGELSWYSYCDTISLANNNVSAEVKGTSGGDGVLQVQFDLKGGSYLFPDYDVDAGSGTSAQDVICLYKFY